MSLTEAELLQIQLDEANLKISQLEAENKDLKDNPPKNPNMLEIWQLFSDIAHTDPPQNCNWYRDKGEKGMLLSGKVGG